MSLNESKKWSNEFQGLKDSSLANTLIRTWEWVQVALGLAFKTLLALSKKPRSAGHESEAYSVIAM